jgi:hypothetical protein
MAAKVWRRGLGEQPAAGFSAVSSGRSARDTKCGIFVFLLRNRMSPD